MSSTAMPRWLWSFLSKGAYRNAWLGPRRMSGHMVNAKAVALVSRQSRFSAND
jgi:hypothetical protein